MSKFDITKHEFSDSRFEHDGGTLNLLCDESGWGVSLKECDYKALYLDFNKQDAIAMAKHFELTAEDLERV